MKPDKPTEKQIVALKKFRIPEGDIERMTFMDASNKLDELIGAIKNRKPSIPADSTGRQSHPNPSADAGTAPRTLTPPNTPRDEGADNVSTRLSRAKKMVAEAFGTTSDAITLDNEPAIELIIECMREEYGSAWLTKDMR